MNHPCVTPLSGLNLGAKRNRGRAPVSICNDECARSGASPEGPGLQGAHRVVAGLGRGGTPTGGLRLALQALQPRRRVVP